MRGLGRLRAAVWRVVRDEAGVGIVEYGLLVALVAVVVASSAAVLGNGVGTLFSNVSAIVVSDGDTGPDGDPGGGGGGGNSGNSGNTNGWGRGSGGGQGHTN